MDKLKDWNIWRDKITAHCYGNWDRIVNQVCNNEAINTLLSNKNITCPDCGKREKLFLADQHTLASHCCSGKCNTHHFDGIATIAALDGITQTDVLKKIAELVNIHSDTYLSKSKGKSGYKHHHPEKQIGKVDKQINPAVEKERQNLLSKLQMVSKDNNVVLSYLQKRGLNIEMLYKSILSNLFFVDSLDYYKELLDENDVVVDLEKGKFPAMVAKVFDCEQNLVGFHKTYLTEHGTKAKVSTPKQLSRSSFKGQYSIKGAVIPLCKPLNGRYGIAEGLETALSVLSMNRPCWSVLNANGIKSFKLPKDCKELDIYGDLDKSGTGQQVVIEKYIEISSEYPNVKINLYLPPESIWDVRSNPKGIDFLDAYLVNNSILPSIGGFEC